MLKRKLTNFHKLRLREISVLWEEFLNYVEPSSFSGTSFFILHAVSVPKRRLTLYQPYQGLCTYRFHGCCWGNKRYLSFEPYNARARIDLLYHSFEVDFFSNLLSTSLLSRLRLATYIHDSLSSFHVKLTGEFDIIDNFNISSSRPVSINTYKAHDRYSNYFH